MGYPMTYRLLKDLDPCADLLKERDELRAALRDFADGIENEQQRGKLRALPPTSHVMAYLDDLPSEIAQHLVWVAETRGWSWADVQSVAQIARKSAGLPLRAYGEEQERG